jgi:hypothetical protein
MMLIFVSACASVKNLNERLDLFAVWWISVSKSMRNAEALMEDINFDAL